MLVGGSGEMRNLTCWNKWNIVLERNGSLPNPGLTTSDYADGFVIDDFMWFGALQLAALTKSALFNLRVEMYDENNDFYYAEFEGVRIEAQSLSHVLTIQRFV